MMGNVSWSEGLRVGAGYDVVRGEAKQEAVVGELEVTQDAAGQSGDMTFIQTHTSEEVDKALEIDAEIKVGVGPFGGSAKMSFREKCKVSQEATFCIVSVTAYNAYQQLVRPRLSDEALELLSTGKRDRFRERFGDNFVSGQYVGAEYYGVVRIEAKTEARQTEIAGEVSASYGMMASGSASTNFKSGMSSAEHKIEIYTFQKGGSVNMCRSIEEMFGNAVRVLDETRAGRGYPFEVSIDPYTELKLPNDDASFIQTEMAERAIREYMRHTKELTKIANDIDFVRRNKDWFDNVDMEKLNAAAGLIADQVNKLSEHADVCSRDFAACQAFSPTYPDYPRWTRKPDAPAAAGGGFVIKPQLINIGPRKMSPALAAMVKQRIGQRRLVKVFKS
ncbi:hypothetical protein [Sphingomonas sp. Leaf412]|uniref:hypothetical protein n=1 Tax=Sphingomonas sp. Leaf412 TaxID=1736370 RepID=UPI0012E3B71E|nr:hypothetical protein [Sphingomonas sp. Leaf412]